MLGSDTGCNADYPMECSARVLGSGNVNYPSPGSVANIISLTNQVSISKDIIINSTELFK